MRFDFRRHDGDRSRTFDAQYGRRLRQREYRCHGHGHDVLLLGAEFACDGSKLALDRHRDRLGLLLHGGRVGWIRVCLESDWPRRGVRRDVLR
jgi:hypothetical protein